MIETLKNQCYQNEVWRNVARGQYRRLSSAEEREK